MQLLDNQIDDQLNFNLHIKTISKTKILIRLKQFLSFHTKEDLYQTSITVTATGLEPTTT